MARPTRISGRSLPMSLPTWIAVVGTFASSERACAIITYLFKLSAAKRPFGLTSKDDFFFINRSSLALPCRIP